MFGPLVLPFQLTVGLYAVIVIGLLVSHRFNRLRFKTWLTFGLVGFVLFPVIFLAIGSAMEPLRYGKFTYPDATGINDGRREVPASARDIELHQFASGHAIRFHVTETAFIHWLKAVDERRANYPDYRPFAEDESFLSMNAEHKAKFWAARFGRYDWVLPTDLRRFKGWRADNGAGFVAYFSPKQGLGFVTAAYW